MKVIFNELDFLDNLNDIDRLFSAELIEDEINNLFNNEYENKKYILQGSIGLWDGTRRVYSYNIYNSIKDAIYEASNDFGLCHITIIEEKYGKLLIEIMHHDGINRLEIKEVTKLGNKILDKHYNDVSFIVNKKGTTKNINFSKNYL